MPKTEEVVQDLLSKGYERNFIYQEMVKKGYNAQEVINALNRRESKKSVFPLIALGIILFSVGAFFFAQFILPNEASNSEDGNLVLNLDFENPNNMHEDTRNLMNIFGHSEKDCYMQINYKIMDSFGEEKINARLNERVMSSIPILLKEKIPDLEQGQYQIKISAECEGSKINLAGKFKIEKAIGIKKEIIPENNVVEEKAIEPTEKTNVSEKYNCTGYQDEDECIIDLAEKNDNEDMCNILSDASSKDSCYANLALTKGISMCEKIEDEYIKFGCRKIAEDLK